MVSGRKFRSGISPAAKKPEARPASGTPSRRLMSAAAAAAYCDMSLKSFNAIMRPKLTAVKNPNATRAARKVWYDRVQIDREIDRATGIIPAFESASVAPSDALETLRLDVLNRTLAYSLSKRR